MAQPSSKKDSNDKPNIESETKINEHEDASNSEVSLLRRELANLRREFNEYKQKMSWKIFNGNSFDKNKEYRIRFNKGGGYNVVEYFDSKTLFFRCSTANHYYGCIEISNIKRWHYRHCGNSAQKVNGYEDNG